MVAVSSQQPCVTSEQPFQTHLNEWSFQEPRTKHKKVSSSPADWTFWTHPLPILSPKKTISSTSYLSRFETSRRFKNIESIKTFVTQNLQDGTCKFSLFKTGIRPVFEDAANRDGGRFFIPAEDFQHGKRIFIELIPLLLQGKLLAMEDVCGQVFSMKGDKISVSIWHSNSRRKEEIRSARIQLKAIFGVKKVPYHSHRSLNSPRKYSRISPSSSLESSPSSSLESSPTSSPTPSPPSSPRPSTDNKENELTIGEKKDFQESKPSELTIQALESEQVIKPSFSEIELVAFSPIFSQTKNILLTLTLACVLFYII